MTSERNSSEWIQTFSGRQFWPLDPRPEDIHIVDIAHALSLINRFTGHTRLPWSVAQHSLLVMELTSSYVTSSLARLDWSAEDRQVLIDARLQALLHDASEAYLADIARPLKHSVTMAPYREAEAKLQGMIFEKYGLSREEHSFVKRADSTALATELRDLMAPPPVPWAPMERPSSRELQRMDPTEAEEKFLRAFNALSPRK